MRWQMREIRPIDVPVEQGRPSASRRLLLGFPQTRSRWTLCSRCTACWCAAAPHAALLPGLPRARFDTVALVALFALPSIACAASRLRGFLHLRGALSLAKRPRRVLGGAWTEVAHGW